MRSFEIPGTSYFVQPLTVPWRTPLFSWNHSTSREDNWLSPNTLVIRVGFLLPFALAFGRWESVPDEEIAARQKIAEERLEYDSYVAVNGSVSYGRWLLAWIATEDVEDPENRTATMQYILTRKERDSADA